MVHKLALFGCLSVLSGCLRVNQPPARSLMQEALPPPNPALVQSCESTRTAHNTWTLVASLLGASAGAGGGLEATTHDQGVQTGLGVGAVLTGILAAGATTVSSIEANQYASDNCATVLTQALSSGATLPIP